MAELKTKATDQSVKDFLDKKASAKVRKDCDVIISLMSKITGEKPKMWGPSIVGFGKYHYRYESGHEGDMCITGFSPRKSNLTLYVIADYPEQEQLLKKLGKHTSSKACLYIKKLEDVDITVLEKMISKSVAYTKKKYPGKK